MMTFNVLEFCRQQHLPVVFSSTREVYGDVHRFEGYAEAAADFAFTESPYSASKIASEAFIYSYARCYGLRYLAYRFSNVYGRYDNDLHRMTRVLPLFIHRMMRGEPVTIYGGPRRCSTSRTSTTASTGSRAGSRRSRSGRVENETINLAYGEGNTLVRAAELIAAALGVEPQMEMAPARLGEVTRYVADIRKARDLFGWEPQTPLDEGIPKGDRLVPRSIARAHPEEDRLVESEGAGAGWKTLATAPTQLAAPGVVLAIFGPTASGKTEVAEAIAERIPAEVVSADSMQAYRGLPILTNQPRRRGSSGSGRSTTRLGRRVPAARARGGRRDPRGGADAGRRRAARASTSAPRSPSWSCRRRRRPGARERWQRVLRPARAASAPTPLLAALDAAAAGAHPPERPPPSRARARARGGGASLAPTQRPALGRRDAAPDAHRRARRAEGRARAADRGADARDVRRGRGGGGARARSPSRCRRRRGRSSASTRSRRCRASEAIEALVVRTRRLRRAISASGCGAFRASLCVAADRPPEEMADEILELARARQRLPAGRASRWTR